MKELKKVLGEDLFTQVQEKLGERKVDFLDQYVPKSRLDEVIEKNSVNEQKVNEFTKQLEETKKLLQTNEDLALKYTKLEEDFQNTLKQKDVELENVKKRFLVKEELMKNGAKHTNLLMKDIDFNSIEIKEDKITNAEDLITNLKTNYTDLFIEKVNTTEHIDVKQKVAQKNEWEEAVKRILK